MYKGCPKSNPLWGNSLLLNRGRKAKAREHVSVITVSRVAILTVHAFLSKITPSYGAIPIVNTDAITIIVEIKKRYYRIYCNTSF